MKFISSIVCASLATSAVAFAPSKQSVPTVSLEASFDPLNLSTGMPTQNKSVMKFASTAAASLAISPLAAMAEELQDDYEYGAVDAPIGLAWGAGVLVILTALLPLALQGGEEAFEEMRQQDSDTWGTGNSNRLNKRR